MKDRLLAQNRKARFDYHIEETFEAGIVLLGTEVKSARAGRINLQDKPMQDVERDGVWLYGMHIAPYEHGNRWNHDPSRPRRAVAAPDGKSIICYGRVREQGYTLVPPAGVLERGTGSKWN